jgi:hypothetical protein
VEFRKTLPLKRLPIEVATRNDSKESGHVKAGAADQKTIDVRLSQESHRILRRHGPPIQDAVDAARSSPKRFESCRRKKACASCAISGVAVSPVPIAQTGS